MNDRPTSDALRIALKSATRRAVEAAGGPNAVSQKTRVSAGRISDYCNESHPSFAPLDICADVDVIAGEPIIRNAWNEYCEAFQKKPQEQIQEHITDITISTGKLFQTAGEAMADGKFSTRDALDTMKSAAKTKSEITDLEVFCAEKVAEAA